MGGADSRAVRLSSWLSDTRQLRAFSVVNIWFWAANQPLVVCWYFFAHDSFVNGAGLLYLSSISVAALWLSSLSWWQSTRVEDAQLTVDVLVEETNIQPEGNP